MTQDRTRHAVAVWDAVENSWKRLAEGSGDYIDIYLHSGEHFEVAKDSNTLECSGDGIELTLARASNTTAYGEQLGESVVIPYDSVAYWKIFSINIT